MRIQLLTDDQIRKSDVDTLKRFVRYRLGGYAVAINDVPAGHPLFRGVHCPERPTTIDRISYPPPERVITCGRANRSGRPMFYCSVGAPAVFYELRAKAGDRIALSAWELVEPLWMHHLGYHEDALQRMGVREIGLRHRLTNLSRTKQEKMPACGGSSRWHSPKISALASSIATSCLSQ
jgi:hypothetical protein